MFLKQKKKKKIKKTSKIFKKLFELKNIPKDVQEYINIFYRLFKIKNTNNINLFNNLYNLQAKRTYINYILFYFFFSSISDNFLHILEKYHNWDRIILSKEEKYRFFNKKNNQMVSSYYWSKIGEQLKFFNNIHFNKNLLYIYKNIHKYNFYYSINNEKNENQFYFSYFLGEKYNKNWLFFFYFFSIILNFLKIIINQFFNYIYLIINKKNKTLNYWKEIWKWYIVEKKNIFLKNIIFSNFWEKFKISYFFFFYNIKWYFREFIYIFYIPTFWTWTKLKKIVTIMNIFQPDLKNYSYFLHSWDFEKNPMDNYFEEELFSESLSLHRDIVYYSRATEYSKNHKFFFDFIEDPVETQAVSDFLQGVALDWENYQSFKKKIQENPKTKKTFDYATVQILKEFEIAYFEMIKNNKLSDFWKSSRPLKWDQNFDEESSGSSGYFETLIEESLLDSEEEFIYSNYKSRNELYFNLNFYNLYVARLFQKDKIKLNLKIKVLENYENKFKIFYFFDYYNLYNKHINNTIYNYQKNFNKLFKYKNKKNNIFQQLSYLNNYDSLNLNISNLNINNNDHIKSFIYYQYKYGWKNKLGNFKFFLFEKLNSDGLYHHLATESIYNIDFFYNLNLNNDYFFSFYGNPTNWEYLFNTDEWGFYYAKKLIKNIEYSLFSDFEFDLRYFFNLFYLTKKKFKQKKNNLNNLNINLIKKIQEIFINNSDYFNFNKIILWKDKIINQKNSLNINLINKNNKINLNLFDTRTNIKKFYNYNYTLNNNNTDFIFFDSQQFYLKIQENKVIFNLLKKKHIINNPLKLFKYHNLENHILFNNTVIENKINIFYDKENSFQYLDLITTIPGDFILKKIINLPKALLYATIFHAIFRWKQLSPYFLPFFKLIYLILILIFNYLVKPTFKNISKNTFKNIKLKLKSIENYISYNMNFIKKNILYLINYFKIYLIINITKSIVKYVVKYILKYIIKYIKINNILIKLKKYNLEYMIIKINNLNKKFLNTIINIYNHNNIIDKRPQIIKNFLFKFPKFLRFIFFYLFNKKINKIIKKTHNSNYIFGENFWNIIKFIELKINKFLLIYKIEYTNLVNLYIKMIKRFYKNFWQFKFYTNIPFYKTYYHENHIEYNYYKLYDYYIYNTNLFFKKNIILNNNRLELLLSYNSKNILNHDIIIFKNITKKWWNINYYFVEYNFIFLKLIKGLLFNAFFVSMIDFDKYWYKVNNNSWYSSENNIFFYLFNIEELIGTMIYREDFFINIEDYAHMYFPFLGIFLGLEGNVLGKNWIKNKLNIFENLLKKKKKKIKTFKYNYIYGNEYNWNEDLFNYKNKISFFFTSHLHRNFNETMFGFESDFELNWTIYINSLLNNILNNKLIINNYNYFYYYYLWQKNNNFLELNLLKKINNSKKKTLNLYTKEKNYNINLNYKKNMNFFNSPDINHLFNLEESYLLNWWYNKRKFYVYNYEFNFLNKLKNFILKLNNIFRGDVFWYFWLIIFTINIIITRVFGFAKFNDYIKFYSIFHDQEMINEKYNLWNFTSIKQLENYSKFIFEKDELLSELQDTYNIINWNYGNSIKSKLIYHAVDKIIFSLKWNFINFTIQNKLNISPIQIIPYIFEFVDKNAQYPNIYYNLNWTNQLNPIEGHYFFGYWLEGNWDYRWIEDVNDVDLSDLKLLAIDYFFYHENENNEDKYIWFGDYYNFPLLNLFKAPIIWPKFYNFDKYFKNFQTNQILKFFNIDEHNFDNFIFLKYQPYYLSMWVEKLLFQNVILEKFGDFFPEKKFIFINPNKLYKLNITSEEEEDTTDEILYHSFNWMFGHYKKFGYFIINDYRKLVLELETPYDELTKFDTFNYLYRDVTYRFVLPTKTDLSFDSVNVFSENISSNFIYKLKGIQQNNLFLTGDTLKELMKTYAKEKVRVSRKVFFKEYRQNNNTWLNYFHLDFMEDEDDFIEYLASQKSLHILFNENKMFNYYTIKILMKWNKKLKHKNYKPFIEKYYLDFNKKYIYLDNIWTKDYNIITKKFQKLIYWETEVNSSWINNVKPVNLSLLLQMSYDFEVNEKVKYHFTFIDEWKEYFNYLFDYNNLLYQFNYKLVNWSKKKYTKKDKLLNEFYLKKQKIILNSFDKMKNINLIEKNNKDIIQINKKIFLNKYENSFRILNTNYIEEYLFYHNKSNLLNNIFFIDFGKLNKIVCFDNLFDKIYYNNNYNVIFNNSVKINNIYKNIYKFKIKKEITHEEIYTFIPEEFLFHYIETIQNKKMILNFWYNFNELKLNKYLNTIIISKNNLNDFYYINLLKKLKKISGFDLEQKYIYFRYQKFLFKSLEKLNNSLFVFFKKMNYLYNNPINLKKKNFLYFKIFSNKEENFFDLFFDSISERTSINIRKNFALWQRKPVILPELTDAEDFDYLGYWLKYNKIKNKKSYWNFNNIFKNNHWINKWNKRFFNYDDYNLKYYWKFNHTSEILNKKNNYYVWSIRYDEFLNLIDPKWSKINNLFYFYPHEIGLKNNWIFPPQLFFNYSYEKLLDFYVFDSGMPDIKEFNDLTLKIMNIDHLDEDCTLENVEFQRINKHILKKYIKINNKNSLDKELGEYLNKKEKYENMFVNHNFTFNLEKWETTYDFLYSIIKKLNNTIYLNDYYKNILLFQFYNSHDLLPYFNYINYDSRKFLIFELDSGDVYLKNYINNNLNYNFFLKKKLNKIFYNFDNFFFGYPIYNNNYLNKDFNIFDINNKYIKYFGEIFDFIFYSTVFTELLDNHNDVYEYKYNVLYLYNFLKYIFKTIIKFIFNKINIFFKNFYNTEIILMMYKNFLNYLNYLLEKIIYKIFNAYKIVSCTMNTWKKEMLTKKLKFFNLKKTENLISKSNNNISKKNINNINETQNQEKVIINEDTIILELYNKIIIKYNQIMTKIIKKKNEYIVKLLTPFFDFSFERTVFVTIKKQFYIIYCKIRFIHLNINNIDDKEIQLIYYFFYDLYNNNKSIQIIYEILENYLKYINFVYYYHYIWMNPTWLKEIIYIQYKLNELHNELLLHILGQFHLFYMKLLKQFIIYFLDIIKIFFLFLSSFSPFNDKFLPIISQEIYYFIQNILTKRGEKLSSITLLFYNELNDFIFNHYINRRHFNLEKEQYINFLKNLQISSIYALQEKLKKENLVTGDIIENPLENYLDFFNFDIVDILNNNNSVKLYFIKDDAAPADWRAAVGYLFPARNKKYINKTYLSYAEEFFAKYKNLSYMPINTFKDFNNYHHILKLRTYFINSSFNKILIKKNNIKQIIDEIYIEILKYENPLQVLTAMLENVNQLSEENKTEIKNKIFFKILTKNNYDEDLYKYIINVFNVYKKNNFFNHTSSEIKFSPNILKKINNSKNFSNFEEIIEKINIKQNYFEQTQIEIIKEFWQYTRKEEISKLYFNLKKKPQILKKYFNIKITKEELEYWWDVVLGIKKKNNKNDMKDNPLWKKKDFMEEIERIRKKQQEDALKLKLNFNEMILTKNKKYTKLMVSSRKWRELFKNELKTNFWTKEQITNIENYLKYKKLKSLNWDYYKNIWKKKKYKSYLEFEIDFMKRYEELYNESVILNDFLKANKILFPKEKESYKVFTKEFLHKFGNNLDLYEDFLEKSDIEIKLPIWGLHNNEIKSKNSFFELEYTIFSWNSDEIISFNVLLNNIIYRIVFQNKLLQINYELFIIYYFRMLDYFEIINIFFSCFGYEKVYIDKTTFEKEEDNFFIFDFKRFNIEYEIFKLKINGLTPLINNKIYPYKNKSQMTEGLFIKVFHLNIDYIVYYYIKPFQMKYYKWLDKVMTFDYYSFIINFNIDFIKVKILNIFSKNPNFIEIFLIFYKWILKINFYIVYPIENHIITKLFVKILKKSIIDVYNTLNPYLFIFEWPYNKFLWFLDNNIEVPPTTEVWIELINKIYTLLSEIPIFVLITNTIYTFVFLIDTISYMPIIFIINLKIKNDFFFSLSNEIFSYINNYEIIYQIIDFYSYITIITLFYLKSIYLYCVDKKLHKLHLIKKIPYYYIYLIIIFLVIKRLYIPMYYFLLFFYQYFFIPIFFIFFNIFFLFCFLFNIFFIFLIIIFFLFLKFNIFLNNIKKIIFFKN